VVRVFMWMVGLLGSKAMWAYRWIPAFQRIVLSPSSGVKSHKAIYIVVAV
jgi:hypothetical protein